jgi:hypothetical protein
MSTDTVFECPGCGCWYGNPGTCITPGCEGDLEEVWRYYCTEDGCQFASTSQWQVAWHEAGHTRQHLWESLKALITRA